MPDPLIYELRCTCHPEQGTRYVGLTTQSLTSRVRQHQRDARSATTNRMHLWMREHDVQADVLEQLPGASRSRLRAAEIRWMAHKRRDGADLLNGTDFWTVIDGVWQRAA